MSFIDKSIFRNLLLSITPIVYTILYAWYFSSTTRSSVLYNAIVLTIIHILAIIHYCVLDNKEEKTRSAMDYQKKFKNCNKKLSAAEDLLNNTESIVANNADILYDVILAKRSGEHSSVKDMHFLQDKADVICTTVFNFIKEIAKKGTYFAVSIMFLEKKIDTDRNITKEYQMVGRHTNYAKSAPKSYRHFVSESEAQGSYYYKIFNDSKRSPYYILASPEEIKESFQDSSDLAYSQYIGIPIFCKDKIVAVLQIVAYQKSRIAESVEEMQLLCDNYLTLFANLFLLSDKIENIQQLL